MRNAWLCTHEDHTKTRLAFRVFLARGESIDEKACPEHGKRAMRRQENRPYLGKPISERAAA